MTKMVAFESVSLTRNKMALLLLFIVSVSSVLSLSPVGEMTLENVTRLATGDIFSLLGSDCGPTRCMEISHGTALAAMGGDSSTCICRCRRDTPTFREDQRVCVNHIDECLMAAFGREATKLNIPFVFLPLKGQIIYPSKEIIFSDVEDAICAVTSAQYLTSSGWVTLRDLIDNDVPFGLYRDEGSTFLQWRGSTALHTRLEGRLIAVHVLCSASTSTRLVASCAAFRVAGASNNGLLDVRSIPFHAGEIVATDSVNQSQGLSVLESLAIGVCVLMLVFVYAAGILFYIHYKQRQKRKRKDTEQNMSSTLSENGSPLESRIDMSNVMLKTNPLLNLSGFGSDFFSSDTGFSDVSEHTEDTVDTSPHNFQKFQKMTKNCNVISAMVHTHRKKPTRPSIRSVTSSESFTGRFYKRATSPDTLERAPHSDLSIVDYNVENNTSSSRHSMPSNTETAFRKKLYFNPAFFETEQLKNPSPAAVEFLVKIREVMSIAKEKMTTKRFLPMLSDIPEEDLYHTIDLGWDFPCARRGRRFSAISLKQENSRKSVHCGGCPGCDSKVKPQKTVALTRSNSCKSCVSDDYKQRIVREWLDEVPIPSATKKNMKPNGKNSASKLENEIKIKEIRPKSAEPLKSEEKQPKVKETNSKLMRITKLTKEDIVIADPKFEAVTHLDNKVNKLDNNDIKPDTDTKPAHKITPITTSNKDLKKEGESKTTNKTLKPKDFNKNEEKKPGKPVISSPKPISHNLVQENRSPTSHNSRQIRKKLPPPPPPPVNIPESQKTEEPEPVAPEVKVKMQAVIRELYDCQKVEPVELEEIKMETISPIAPKIVIPVIAADSHYFSDDNMIIETNKKDINKSYDNVMDYDSLERNAMRHRRFSIACRPELSYKENLMILQKLQTPERLVNSWRDIKKAVEEELKMPESFLKAENRSPSVCEVFVENCDSLYNNISTPGPLTIQVRGSPLQNRRNSNEDFDPDTLDRKPKRDVKKRVEKIFLKSAGSFKHKATSSETDTQKKSPDIAMTKKIGNLRQIYEAKAKAQKEETQIYNRRGSVPYGRQDMPPYLQSLKTPDLIRHIESQKDPKPPVPPKAKRGIDLSPKFSNTKRDSPPSEYRRTSEDRDRFSGYARFEHLNARRSGRRSARTRSRRTDLRKLYRTEDSGYMSTDSNESKRKARYLMQLRPKTAALHEPIQMQTTRTVIKSPILQIESDTDEFESLGDGRSESGGESVETDSVFFGNCDDSKELFAELGLCAFDSHTKNAQGHEQIDSGFIGETNIILSGDSDSEHRSVISIVTGHDGRVSAESVSNLDDSPYLHTIQC